MNVVRLIGAATFAAGVASAHAAPPALRTMLVPVERVPPLAAPLPGPNVLYVNDCKPAGCTVSPGIEDSRTNKSSIVTQSRVLPPYGDDAATWDAMLACVRENYAPFNITVVTTDPGTAPHYEVMVAGDSTDLGLPAGIGGVAPFACGVVPNGLAFAFAKFAPADALAQCWTASQESAHVFGLEHSMLATDAMTYALTPARKRFVDETACIGTQGCCQPAAECLCGPTTINTYQRLAAVLGEIEGTITIASPADGDVVPSGFPIEVAVVAPRPARSVEVSIDDVLFARFAAPPYALNADASLALGTHTITARFESATGTTQTTMISVVRGAQEPPAPEPEPEPDPALRTRETGCSTGDAGGAGTLVALALLASAVRRRGAR